MKMKEIGPRGGLASLASPPPLRSETGFYFYQSLTKVGPAWRSKVSFYFDFQYFTRHLAVTIYLLYVRELT